jgi:membrane associated rhomboid family serine protease
MLNEPQPGKERRPHPLERPPQQDRQAAPQPGQKRQQAMLHIPVARPTVTYTLIAINVAIYILAALLMSEGQANDLYEWGANNRTQVIEHGEYHRLLTSMFLHSLNNPAHIVFNMFALYFFGIIVERFYGHARFLIIYFLGGLSGSLLSVLLSNVYSVGASGAMFAILGAEMAFLYHHRKLLNAMARQQLRALVVIAGMNLLVGLTGEFVSGGAGIDNWAHLGGLAGGLFLSWYLSPIFNLRRHPTQEGALVTEDINPLNEHYQLLALFVSGQLALLIIATLMLR